jgi:acyl carrier protein
MVTDMVGPIAELHARQWSIQSRRVCPTNAFVEFTRDEIEQSIPARFEQQVRRDPKWLAVKAKRDTLTYDELNRAANRVARAILAQIPGEEPIGLLLEHGAPMIVAILGVLKAGRIKEGVVVAREEKAGDQRLVAYVIPAPESSPTSGELQRL